MGRKEEVEGRRGREGGTHICVTIEDKRKLNGEVYIDMFTDPLRKTPLFLRHIMI